MSPESEQNSAAQEDGKPIRQSRWVERSKVPRYTKEQEKDLDSFVESPGWGRGARVRSA